MQEFEVALGEHLAHDRSESGPQQLTLYLGSPWLVGTIVLPTPSRGDLPWIASNLGFSHANSTQPSMMCKRTNLGNERDSVPWTDCNEPPSLLLSCWTD